METRDSLLSLFVSLFLSILLCFPPSLALFLFPLSLSDVGADPDSGRPLELYVDCSDYACGAILAQRTTPKGRPRPIATYSRSLTPTEQAWSTFERELFGLREAIMASEPLTKGFFLVVLTDHKNNHFTGSVLATRRVNKKLLRWACDLEEMGDRIRHVWIKRSDNVLGDAPSRYPRGRDFCKYLRIPSSLVNRIVGQMFRPPVDENETRELDSY